MSVELIAMLTWHDVTVNNAKEIFLAAKDAPATHWGFKIEGTTPESMKELVECMKENGKKVYIEILAIKEDECLDAVRKCIECKADHVLGTVYYESVAKLLKDAGIAYSPFVGLAEDARLRGTVDAIADEAKRVEEESVFGINVSAFRYVEGNPVELLKTLGAGLKKPFSIAGSVDSFEKIDILKSLPNLYGFTIGGAFFENKFDGTFAEQITKVVNYLKEV